MAKHLIISGEVQGVGYRAAFEARARHLRLSGWVRNRRDGTVEALIDGEPAALTQIVTWAKRGPAAAQVREVKVADVDHPEVIDDGFSIRQTA